ncbi:GNAT family acetyltransferase-like protein [Phaeosphaeriaceae sp. PMI808]|nr:GNAT family acetyltransferase-like protein [Phaeosphaeriaceae sp. PMI808]
MQSDLFTPRLKLTLITTAERGSQELEWLHALRSDEKATWWSIAGRSKSLEDTERVVKAILPLISTPSDKQDDRAYKIAYAVHEVAPYTITESGLLDPKDDPTHGLAGLIIVRKKGTELPLPASLFPESTLTCPETLTVEIGYQFLPGYWNRGYATESIAAVFSACSQARSFWSPFKRVYLIAVVNAENPASKRVMEKSGMKELGIYEWTGDAIYLAGKWRTREILHIFGTWLWE